MFGVGGSEIIFIIFIALMLFGTDKLPETIRTFAKVIANLKNATNEIKSEIQKSADLNGIESSIKNITTNFNDEVTKVKESVTPTNLDLGQDVLKDATDHVNTVKEDIDNLTGPIKRQM